MIEARTGKGTDGMSRFEGNLVLTTSVVTKVLKRIHPPISRLANEVGELAVLAADMDMPFVRDSKMVDGGYVFFLGLDDMLMHASTRISFAGDATYRTVSEANRSVKEGRWYLYNIVVHASRERLNGGGVVVMRALMTGLTAGYYYAIWKYFFDSIARAKNLRNGEMDLDPACIMVPYIDTNPSIRNRSCLVASITMDFDVAEIHGCASALRALCGGTMETHLGSGFIGCEVHLKRDLLRRARDEKTQKDTGKTSDELYSEYSSFAYAKTRAEAESQLKKIKTFDPAWVQWVEGNKMGPLISMGMSSMSPTHRTIAFSNTNVVESQNRRGNHLVGTGLRPGEAARGLYDLDKVDAEKLHTNSRERIEEVGIVRRRSDSILRPVLPSRSGTKKLAKTGGPTQKKNKTRRIAAGTSRKGTKSAMETSTQEKSRGSRRGSAQDYEEVSVRLQDGIANISEQIRAGTYGSATPEQRVARLDTLVGIMAGAHAVSSVDKVDKVKQALLDGLQSNREDIPFREALLHLCISCFGCVTTRHVSGPLDGSPQPTDSTD